MSLSTVSTLLKNRGPITSAEFRRLMTPLLELMGPVSRVGVAVSGGPDSMALLFLLRRLLPLNCHLQAFTVDHKLREGSTEEAHRVQQYLKSRGLHSEILTIDWQSTSSRVKPTTRIMESAREQRFMLLSKACKERSVRHLFLGHHLNDNTENVLFRFARGSGIDGLAGTPIWRLDWGTIRGEESPLMLMRPLLPVPKERLLATCKGMDLRVVEDPTNADTAFTRNWLRKRLREHSEDTEGRQVLMPFSEQMILKLQSVFAVAKRQAWLEVANVLKKSAEYDGQLGMALLTVRGVDSGRKPPPWMSWQGIAARVLNEITGWVAPPSSPAARRKTLTRISEEMHHHVTGRKKFKNTSVRSCVVAGPRPTTGLHKFIATRQPPYNWEVRDAVRRLGDEPMLFDERFLLKLLPGAPVSGAKDHLQFLEISSPRLANFVKSPEDFDLWVRFITDHDAKEAMKILEGYVCHAKDPTLWGKRLQALARMRRKLPVSGRCTLPVVTIREKAQRDEPEYECGRRTGLDVKTRSQAVCFPSLQIHLSPDVFDVALRGTNDIMLKYNQMLPWLSLSHIFPVQDIGKQNKQGKISVG